MQIDFIVVESVDPEVYLFESIFQNAMEAELEMYALVLTYLLVNDYEMPTAHELETHVLAIREKHLKWRRERITEFLEVIANAKESQTT